MVQEVALAKAVTFLCGEHEISLDLMEQAVVDSWQIRNWVIYDLTNMGRMQLQGQSHDDSIIFSVRHIVQADSSTHNVEGNAHQTIRIANLLNDQACFAPQDRVLGILGMIQEEFEVVREDLHTYTSIPDLYTRFSTLMFEASGPAVTDWHWWYYLGMTFSLNRIEGLPSWVPDLHHQDPESKRRPLESMLGARVYSDPPWQASSRSCIASKGSEPDEIVLRGKLLDEVVLAHPEVPHFPDDLEPGYGDGMTWLAVLVKLIRWESKLADAVVYGATKGGGVSEETYWRTLLSGMSTDFVSGTQFTHEMWLQFCVFGQQFLEIVPRLEELKRYVIEYISLNRPQHSTNSHSRESGTDPWDLPDWTQSEGERATMDAFRNPEHPVARFTASICFTRHHQLFNTEGGRFGFTATGVQAGDVVCVFNNAVSPHVLRRVEDRDGKARYIFMGDAYVSGLMYEEADNMDVKEVDIVLV